MPSRLAESASCYARLRLGDGLGPPGAALAAAEVETLLAVDGLGSLLDDLGALGEDHLDVAGVGHVRVDLRSRQSPKSRRRRMLV